MSELNCTVDCGRHQSPGPGAIAPAAGQPVVETWLGMGAAVVDHEGKILACNDALAAWLGSVPAALQGLPLTKVLGRRCPDWEGELEALLARHEPFDRLELASTGQGHERLSIELCGHGQTRFLRLESAVPKLSELEDLFPESCWGQALSHSLFQRMVRAEAQIENLMSCWPGIIFSQRPDFTFVFVSPKIEELTGVPPSEWRRQSRLFWDIVHEADADALAARMRFEGAAAKGATSTFRIRHVHTGRVTYLWEHRRAIRSSNCLVLGWEGIWLDITRQSIAERRLLNMSWRENLGTLSMGLAHDFCNIMTGIVGLSETFEASLEADNSVRGGLALIRETAMQASQLAHRIRQLHQGLPGEKNYADLNESIAGLAELLQKVLPRRVRVQTHLAPGQLPVYVDAVELQQVVVNLALNAADAMPRSGQLTFRTARHEQLPVTQHLQGALPRLPLICLSVEDTGSGIPARFLGSIFDPFFTTKPLGKGSGLGLYNARLFSEKHGAAISVETKEGAGTTFHLWFAQADFTEAQQTLPAEPPVRHTLLVVGATSELREPVVTMLRQNGYYVVPAAGAAEALEALHEPHYQFTAVFVLCHQGGAEELAVCQRIRTLNLPLKTLLSVIGCNQDELPAGALEAADAVVPFDAPPQDFLARLKTALNSK